MHARTLAALDAGLRLHFASRDGARARSFADRLGGAAWFEGYEAALSDERTRVVVVVTPPARHLEWTLAALEAGKHVVVEKPAFPRSSDFDRVEAAARRAGRQVLVAENYPYKPLAGALRRLVQSGDLGRLLAVQLNAMKRQEAHGWRADPALVGGGALLEGGIHWISLLTDLGPVRAVRAVAPGMGRTPERTMALALEYQGGAVGSLLHSWEAPSALRGLRLSRLYGTEGSAVFESNGLFLASFGRRWRVRGPARDLRGFRAMFRDLFEALRTGRAPRYDLSRARRDVELVEEAYRSAGLGTTGPDPTSTDPSP
jgi:predicted dehydrogenase